MEFNYGLTYDRTMYGWKDKQLYRLPFIRNNRAYGLKLIKPVMVKSTICYNLQRKKITINRIKLMTEKIDIVIEIVKDKDCPF